MKNNGGDRKYVQTQRQRTANRTRTLVPSLDKILFVNNLENRINTSQTRFDRPTECQFGYNKRERERDGKYRYSFVLEHGSFSVIQVLLTPQERRHKLCISTSGILVVPTKLNVPFQIK